MENIFNTGLKELWKDIRHGSIYNALRVGQNGILINKELTDNSIYNSENYLGKLIFFLCDTEVEDKNISFIQDLEGGINLLVELVMLLIACNQKKYNKEIYKILVILSFIAIILIFFFRVLD